MFAFSDGRFSIIFHSGHPRITQSNSGPLQNSSCCLNHYFYILSCLTKYFIHMLPAAQCFIVILSPFFSYQLLRNKTLDMTIVSWDDGKTINTIYFEVSIKLWRETGFLFYKFWLEDTKKYGTFIIINQQHSLFHYYWQKQCIYKFWDK